MDNTILNHEIAKIPIFEYAFFKANEIIFSDEVQKLCKKNDCGMYGTSWACPPAVGSTEKCREQCLNYEHAFIFTTVTEVMDSYDIQSWHDARVEHEKITDDVAMIFKSHYKDPLILSTEGCTVCEICTFPHTLCRFPDRMYPATEGYGILVMQQAQLCNIQYDNGFNMVTYFSLILFNS